MLHVVFYCDNKHIEIIIAAANQCFTALTAKKDGFLYFPFFGVGQRSYFLFVIKIHEPPENNFMSLSAMGTEIVEGGSKSHLPPLAWSLRVKSEQHFCIDL